jgi:hypothetical protein
MIYFVRKLIKNGGLIQLNLLIEEFRKVFNYLKCLTEINIETLDTARTKSKIQSEICIML